MKIISILLVMCFSILHAETILVMNSNAKVTRYSQMEKSFKKHIDTKIQHVDIAKMSKKEVKEYLYKVYPDVIYAIGTKAYQYAYNFVPEKKIFFSSIVSYKRLHMNKNIFGVANELHTGMRLTLIKSLLSKTKSLSLIYSRYTKDIYKSFEEEAKNVGIEITGQMIGDDDVFDMQKILNSDAFMMIADPILIKNESKIKALFKEMKRSKKPVIAYHKAYINYGAMLVLSVDTMTIGKQVASMMYSEKVGALHQRIQVPIGSEVIFNEGLAKRMGVYYNKSALDIVNKVIE